MKAPSTQQLQQTIDRAWEDRASLSPDSAPATVARAVARVLDELDQGRLRVAEKLNGSWVTHQWIKKAVLLSFRLEDNRPIRAGLLRFYDKVPTKFERYDRARFKRGGFRVVPPAVARRGAYIGKNVVLMPSYVNVGAYVDEGTMVDTWATVGSCAQVGDDVHLSGGVGIGGVLEPLQATPVIVEDGAFIGSRCIVVEGVIVEERAVLGAGVVLTASTPIVDVTGAEPVEHRGRVPAGAVVIPGTRAKRFAAGEYGTPVALIIGRRSAATDLKVSLNDTLREHGLSAGS